MTKGCFSEGDTAYFGIGGDLEDMFIDPLPGNKERLWCDFDAVPDTMPETKEGPNPTVSSTFDLSIVYFLQSKYSHFLISAY